MIDDNYYSTDATYKININQNDKTAPTISITNPSDGNIKIYQNQNFNLRATVEDTSPLKSINIYLDNTPLKIGEKERTFSYSINADNSIPP